ncbi:flagellar protein FlaG [Pseudomonas sp. R3.Fl]|uniref:flagellar protein FlaG n=1 Tax=Pseudomonas sp. R3.Fl TaxID=2928708 RepID=UPI00201E4308|nr:flagellar protein FlaG [Pseudomonas sp. R3.Fl]MCL6691771.1 flagellar protein FlaG [Pseudomonas sp. R3.Fl]
MTITLSTLGSTNPAPAATAQGPIGVAVAGGKSTVTPGKDSPSDGNSASLPDRASLERAVDDLRSSSQMIHRNLEFSLDEDSGITVVKVVDAQSGDLIRQIPSEVAVRLAESFRESGNLLFSEQA